MTTPTRTPHRRLASRAAAAFCAMIALPVAVGIGEFRDALAADVGTPAPPFALPTAAGTPVALADLRGRVVYVDFWASWCGPCRRSFPWMNELQKRYAARGLAIVAVNVDKKRADADRFLQQFPATFPVVFDPAGSTPAAYAVPGMPTSYLIDARGGIVQVEQGFLDERRAAIEARIEALLAAR